MTPIACGLPAWNTGILRYDFQIACVRRHSGRVLNIGCNEDPCQLRRRFGNRVVNCDREGWDERMNRPNVVDAIFDALNIPWPFDDDCAELVVLGDILEHFPVDKSIAVLREAHRVATNVCITVPEDIRINEQQQHDEWQAGTYNLHTTIVTREILNHLLDRSGWQANWIVRGDWGFDNIQGWCVRAHRAVGVGVATGGILPKVPPALQHKLLEDYASGSAAVNPNHSVSDVDDPGLRRLAEIAA